MKRRWKCQVVGKVANLTKVSLKVVVEPLPNSGTQRIQRIPGNPQNN